MWSLNAINNLYFHIVSASLCTSVMEMSYEICNVDLATTYKPIQIT